MSELGLYEGCFVELQNGEIKGPLRYTGQLEFCWSVDGGTHLWNRRGRSGWAGGEHLLIVKVIEEERAKALIKFSMSSTYGKVDSANPHISHFVLQAAKDAGMRAKPAYDDFVTAIVHAAFLEAGKADEARPPFRISSDLIAIALDEAEASFKKASNIADIRTLRIKNISRLIQNEIAKNESAPGSNVEEKTEGGLSDQDALQLRTLDKLHPAVRSFLEAIYPDAPLRAVEFIPGLIRAGYGRPMKPAAEITVGVSLPGRIPMWIDDAGADEKVLRESAPANPPLQTETSDEFGGSDE